MRFPAVINRAALGAALFVCALTYAHAGPAEDRALITAAERGDVAAIRKSLADGAGVNARDSAGRTALLVATYANRVEGVRVLIAAGADVNAKYGDDGKVHTEIVRDLVAPGVNVNLADGDGVTPLAHARRRGFAAMARILEAAGGR